MYSKTSALNSRARGSVIVLVVAVLALLAVLGTVYLVTARTERNSATARQSVVNTELAQEAVMNMVRRAQVESTLDAYGVVGGSLDENGAGVVSLPPFANTLAYGQTSPPTKYTSRRFTFPEWNQSNAGASSYAAGANGLDRDQSWLAADTYREMGTPFGTTDLSILTAKLYDPVAATYTRNIVPSDAFNAVSNFYYPDPTVSQENIPGATKDNDSLIQFLPMSDPTGIRYRFGARIVDTSGMANLNVGMPFTFNASYPDLKGTYFNSYCLAVDNAGDPTRKAIFDNSTTYVSQADTPLNLASMRQGTVAFTNAAPSLGYIREWIDCLFSIENGGAGANFFDLADELELRSYGTVGTAFRPRPALCFPAANHAWTNTLGVIPNDSMGTTGIPKGNNHRAFYTTYSFSRDLRLFPNPVTTNSSIKQYTVNNVTVFPVFPACVSANPELTGVAPAIVASAATNIATLMEASGFPQGTAYTPPKGGYSPVEAVSFAANYITFRLNSWQTNGSAWSLPNGPSFVDDQGICVRGPTGATAEYTGASDLKAAAGTIHFGYAAQPFLNEIAEIVEWVADPANPGQFLGTVTDSAVELYNPYGVALDLSDYKLRVNGADIDLSGKTIPAYGYFVLSSNNGTLDSLVAGSNNQKAKDVAMLLGNSASKVELMRKYLNRAGTTTYAAVDEYNCAPLAPDAGLTKPSSAGPLQYYMRRSNTIGLAANTSDWRPTIHDPSKAEVVYPAPGVAPEKMSLGEANNDDPGSAPGLPLYDRYVPYIFNAPSPGQGTVLENIAEFNHVMRLCTLVDAATGLPAGGGAGTIPAQMFLLISGGTPLHPQVANTQFPLEASLHFDFLAGPWVYDRTQPKPADVPSGFPYQKDALVGMPFKPGDMRAVYLLENITFTDRYSNANYDAGDNNDKIAPGLNKLRIPGRININTAPAEVLGAIPVLANNPALVGYLIAYRNRSNFQGAGSDPRIPNPYDGGSPFDFSVTPYKPAGVIGGMGFHSLAEILAPTVAVAGPAATLDDRDRLWAQMYNCLTVRSDTFAVYGYLEAVRKHPKYGSALTANDWYTNTAATITDDPASTGGQALLRVARRRWVAIIDSSYCNYSRWGNLDNNNAEPNPRFSLPKIVAMKELPE